LCIIYRLRISHYVSFFLIEDIPDYIHLSNSCFCTTSKSFKENIFSFIQFTVILHKSFWSIKRIVLSEVVVTEMKETYSENISPLNHKSFLILSKISWSSSVLVLLVVTSNIIFLPSPISSFNFSK